MSISSPDFYSVTSTDRSATQVPADSVNKAKIQNLSGGTLYYKNASDVSSSSSDGNLTAGQTVTVSTSNWIVTTSTVNVAIIPIAGRSDLGDDVVAGTLAVTGASTLTGAVTLTGSTTVTPASSPTGVATWQPPTATSGTDTAFASGTVFVGSIYVPANKTLTGIAFLLGSVGGTDKVVVQLNSSSGTLLANSTLTASGTTAGTAANTQAIDFTSTVAVTGPARYWIGVSANGATAKLRTVPAFCQAGMFGNSLSQTAATPATIVAPTTFTADKAPIAWVY